MGQSFGCSCDVRQDQLAEVDLAQPLAKEARNLKQQSAFNGSPDEDSEIIHIAEQNAQYD